MYKNTSECAGCPKMAKKRSLSFWPPLETDMISEVNERPRLINSTSNVFFFHWMPAFHLETRTPSVVTIFRAIVRAYEKHASTIRWACRIWLDNKWLKKRFGLKELKHTLTHAYTPTNAKLYHLKMKRNTKEAELIWIQITHMPQTIRPSLYQVMVLLFIIKHLQAIWTGMREEKNSIKSNEKEEKNS